jgi:hypothetical protein
MQTSLLGKFEYAYGRLDPPSQLAYRRMLECIQDHRTIYKRDYPDVSSLELSRILLCIDMDHPELFWMDDYQSMLARVRAVMSLDFEVELGSSAGYEGAADLDGDGRVSVSERLMAGAGSMYSMAPWVLWAIDDKLVPRPRMSEASERRMRETIDRAVEKCRECIPPDANDYEILKATVAYIAHNTRYNLRKARKSQDIRSVFARGESVCKGYSEALQYLLLCFGVPCFTVNGVVRMPDADVKVAHAWNYVMVDGKWCIVDATWADADWEGEKGEGLPKWLRESHVRFEYLCIDGRDRVAADVVAYPKRSNASDYFLREGRQVDRLRFSSVAPHLFHLLSGERRYVLLRTRGSVYRLVEYLERVSRGSASAFMAVGGDAGKLEGLSDEECTAIALTGASRVGADLRRRTELAFFPMDTEREVLLVWSKADE